VVGVLGMHDQGQWSDYPRHACLKVAVAVASHVAAGEINVELASADQ
jgi:hypothetical protein